MPVLSEVLIMSVIGGINTGRHSFSTEIGTGSREQDLGGLPLTILRTSSSEAGQNWSSVALWSDSNESV